MRIRTGIIFRLVLVVCFMISATSVANPVGDAFQINGSLKFSDIIFLVLVLGLFFVSKYISHILLVVKTSPVTMTLFFLYASFMVISMLANLESLSERMFVHFFRLIYYTLIIFMVSYISLYYMKPLHILSAMYIGVVIMCSSILYMMFFLDMGLQYGDNTRKLDSVLGANPVANYAAIFFPMGLFLIKKARSIFSKIIIFMSVAILVIAALLAESKASWLAMIVSLLIFFIFLDRREKVIAIVISSLICLVVFEPVYIIVEREIMGSGSNSQERFDFILHSLDFFLDNPFFGIGASNYIIVSPLGHDPHNVYALILAEIGLFGFLSYGFLLLSIIIGLYLRRDDMINQLLLMLMISVSILGLFTGLIASQLVLFIFIGLYVGKNIQRKLASESLKISSIGSNSI